MRQQRRSLRIFSPFARRFIENTVHLQIQLAYFRIVHQCVKSLGKRPRFLILSRRELLYLRAEIRHRLLQLRISRQALPSPPFELRVCRRMVFLNRSAVLPKFFADRFYLFLNLFGLFTALRRRFSEPFNDVKFPTASLLRNRVLPRRSFLYLELRQYSQTLLGFMVPVNAQPERNQTVEQHRAQHQVDLRAVVATLAADVEGAPDGVNGTAAFKSTPGSEILSGTTSPKKRASDKTDRSSSRFCRFRVESVIGSANSSAARVSTVSSNAASEAG